MPNNSTDTPGQEELDNLKKRIEEFVEEFLPNLSDNGSGIGDCPKPEKSKIINDSVWGTFKLQPHEVCLLDTKLMQRLRFIKQTGSTYLTYPSSIHTRFEHTLGVLAKTAEIIKALRTKAYTFEPSVVDNLRMAAILHDVGHGPFSHTSEYYFSTMAKMSTILEYKGDLGYYGCGAGEILSSLIVKSKAFDRFLSKLKSKYEKFDLNAETISNLITGQQPPGKMYQHEIIHGPMDADKLDYLRRDGKFSGLSISLDLDRLKHSIKIKHVPGTSAHRIVGTLVASTPLEQIAFNKMMLFSGIYHHHKVRAVDCMLWTAFELAENNQSKIGGQKIKEATDFLYITDDKLLIPDLTNNPKIEKIIQDIRDRKLWKRALVISRETIKSNSGNNKASTSTSWNEFLTQTSRNENTHLKTRRSLAKEIWKEAGEPCAEYEVYLDSPKLPQMTETRRALIHVSGDKLIELERILPVKQWVEEYGTHKWRAHVFCPQHCQVEINKAAKKVLDRKFGLKFQKSATEYAKIN